MKRKICSDIRFKNKGHFKVSVTDISRVDF